MRLLVTTEALADVGGTETYVLTLAEQVQRLGHEVRLYSPNLGAMAGQARERGLEVLGDLADLAEPADVVVAQDAATSYELAAAWPDVPQVFVCHSAMFDLQQPPLVPGVVAAVVVMSERIRARVEALDGDFTVVRLRQPIDTERLVPRQAPRPVPTRALLLGSYLNGEARRLIRETWSALGVEVVQVGATARHTLQPEEDIAAADIVVGKGRAVLDAMSCGRAAYVYDAFGSDGWVTPASYPAIEADSIAGQAFPDVIDAARLRTDLAAYDPAMGHANRTLVLKHHQARTHAQDLVRVCRDVAPGGARPVREARELARLVRLRWRSESELHALRSDLQERAARHHAELEEHRGQVAVARAEAASAREELRESWEDRVRLEAELAQARLATASAERRRDRARGRGRRFKAHYDQLRTSRWVRLGSWARLVPQPSRDEPGT